MGKDLNASDPGAERRQIERGFMCADVAANRLDEPADVGIVARHRALKERGVHDRLAE